MRIKRAIVAGAVLAATLGSGTAWATPELSTNDQLKTRRYVAAGDRAYVMGFQDGRFYAQGWHVTRRDGRRLVAAAQARRRRLVRRRRRVARPGDEVHAAAGATRGWTSRTRPGLKVSRTDFAPDGRARRAVRPAAAQPGRRQDRRQSPVDAHSESDVALPVGVDDAERGRLQRRRHRRVRRRRARVPRHGHAAPTPARTTGPRPWARTSKPDGGEAGAGHWGSQTAPVLCTAESQFFCDEGPFGKGTGGQLRYTRQGPGARRADPVGRRRRLRQGHRRGARRARRRARRPRRARSPTRSPSRERLGALHEAVAARRPAARARASSGASRTSLDLTQRADDLKIRDVDEGKAYPPPRGHRPARALDRRGLPGLPVDLRHRRRVHGVRVGRPSASSRRSRTTRARCATSR